LSRPSLRLVPELAEPTPVVSFCGHCGQAPSPSHTGLNARVCARCGLGVVVTAAADLAPRERESFLIVDTQLKVCALSRGAERLLGLAEPAAVHRHVSEFLEPADAEAGAGDAFLKQLVSSAALGFAPAVSVTVRPTGEYGVRYAGRVGACGPPEGALIVLGTV
jgi:hypothetical protein